MRLKLCLAVALALAGPVAGTRLAYGEGCCPNPEAVCSSSGRKFCCGFTEADCNRGSGGSRPAAPAYNPGQAALESGAEALGNAAGQAVANWLFSKPDAANLQRQQQLQLQRQRQALERAKAAEAARRRAFEKDKQGLLGDMKGGEEELGFKSADDAELKLKDDDEPALKDLGGSKRVEAHWCELNKPLRPQGSINDVMGVAKDRMAIYQRRLKDWNKRCGGTENEAEDHPQAETAPAARPKAAVPQAPPKAASETLGLKDFKEFEPEQPPPAEKPSASAPKEGGTPDDKKDEPAKAPVPTKEEVLAAEDEVGKKASGVGFDTKGDFGTPKLERTKPAKADGARPAEPVKEIAEPTPGAESAPAERQEPRPLEPERQAERPQERRAPRLGSDPGAPAPPAAVPHATRKKLSTPTPAPPAARSAAETQMAAFRCLTAKLPDQAEVGRYSKKVQAALSQNLLGTSNCRFQAPTMLVQDIDESEHSVSSRKVRDKLTGTTSDILIEKDRQRSTNLIVNRNEVTGMVTFEASTEKGLNRILVDTDGRLTRASVSEGVGACLAKIFPQLDCLRGAGARVCSDALAQPVPIGDVAFNFIHKPVVDVSVLPPWVRDPLLKAHSDCIAADARPPHAWRASFDIVTSAVLIDLEKRAAGDEELTELLKDLGYFRFKEEYKAELDGIETYYKRQKHRPEPDKFAKELSAILKKIAKKRPEAFGEKPIP